MRHFSLLIASICTLYATSALAVSFFADALYWRATESIDWVLTNNLNSSNQTIGYQTISYQFDPGFRVGLGVSSPVDTKIYFTKFRTDVKDSATGNLTPTFLGAKLAGGTYTRGNTDFDIDYNVIDWDIGKHFQSMPYLDLMPFIGVKGGWINQDIVTTLTGSKNITEYMKNDFSGIGPKVGISASSTGWHYGATHINLNTIFSAGYLWGHWELKDIANGFDVGLNNHEFGSLAIQSSLGIAAIYHNLSLSLNYELNDWFNQAQIFDDATGGHNNDLILQGLILGITWNIN